MSVASGIRRSCVARGYSLSAQASTFMVTLGKLNGMPAAQNSNGIDSTVARLSFGMNMKWMYRRVVFGFRCPADAAS